MSGDAGGLRVERFPLGTGPDGAPDARTAAWVRAVGHGFYDAPSPERTAELVRAAADDGRTATAAYDDAQPEGSLPAELPVATYGTFRKPLTVPGGGQVPAHLVTAVTVRTSHRRRGILTRMMGEDLRAARDSGVAVAALMASEATIYGRFGFGIAAREATVRLDARGGAGLRDRQPGRVVAVDPAALGDTHDAVFAAFHARWHGSIGRQAAYRRRATGAWSADGPHPNPKLRAAVHLDADGSADGFATYEFAGWDSGPPLLRVRDLVAATPAARIALWGHLADHDLIERVEWDHEPVDSELPAALRDPRRLETTGTTDSLWLRILDAPAALAARTYAGDGALVLDVDDPAGLAGGSVLLTASGGSATATALDGGPLPAGLPRLRLGVDALAGLYLGGTSAAVLAAAGRIDGPPEAIGLAARLFATVRAPYCRTAF